jgi:hypothetical protein
MENKNKRKLPTSVNLFMTVLVFSIFGWVYYMGIVCPSFASPFREIYRGIGSGMLFLLYFQLIPVYIKRFFPSFRYAPAVVSLVSAVITVVLLISVLPLQVS